VPASPALRAWFGRHPWWVGAWFGFCLYMTFLYVPFDFLLKPLWQDVSQAQEVWFGVLLRGWAAKLTEPLHGLVYGALAWGLWKERPWVWPASALYVGQIAVGMLIWSLRDERGSPAVGCVAFVLFAAVAVVLWRYGRRASSPARS
jgi:hypothetical protein